MLTNPSVYVGFFSLLRKTISSASENYPESIGTMYFINAPRTFSTLWSAIRGWLRERTINKIKLLSQSQPELLGFLGMQITASKVLHFSCLECSCVVVCYLQAATRKVSWFGTLEVMLFPPLWVALAPLQWLTFLHCKAICAPGPLLDGRAKSRVQN